VGFVTSVVSGEHCMPRIPSRFDTSECRIQGVFVCQQRHRHQQLNPVHGLKRIHAAERGSRAVATVAAVLAALTELGRRADGSNP